MTLLNNYQGVSNASARVDYGREGFVACRILTVSEIRPIISMPVVLGNIPIYYIYDL